ncbi:DHBP synthase RibB-like alpha/beta domain-containing protein [Hygrophoropsis aurantiaca]|uniref:DHBP synthase RibB-like alpha/beta domain-containing protein n=1 Tax=Hygrophoropsis aurantiaca TaxID=72124 RepID=A0ACB8A5L0_9AGAM|nr:DHBP synthase RibB-like alpha/beta domain-containing protein [Hygrophoropsis aurantiaca]
MNALRAFLTKFRISNPFSSSWQTPMRVSTQVLKCDVSSISFSADEQPEITCADTLKALKDASHYLTDLLQPIAFPTETVYGLGALALDSAAASLIFSTKGRPPDNPLIVHVSSSLMLQSLLPPNYILPPSYEVLIKHFWPGPLTLLFPSDPKRIPSIITANQPTVAIRMPSHPVARALIAISNAPLAAPSANSSGKPSPTRAEHVLHDLGGKIGIILDGGPCDVGLESTVIDGLHEDGNIRILRPGGVTVEAIEQVLRDGITDGTQVPRVLVHRRDFSDDSLEQAPTTPGMKYRHYSPAVPVTLLWTSSSPPFGTETVSPAAMLGSIKGLHSSRPVKVGILAPTDSPLLQILLADEAVEWHQYRLGSKSEPAITAQRLFDGLLTLEKESVDIILIEEVGEEQEGLAIMNRVKKAAGESRWVCIA